MRIPRGIRNNNPGNIRDSATKWLGESLANRDPEFEEFEKPVHGIRALAKVLLTYQRKHHLDTVDEIIRRWAPPTENNTAAYVTHVADALRVRDYELIDLTDRGVLAALVKAIIRHENGCQPYDDETIDRGVAMALDNSRG